MFFGKISEEQDTVKGVGTVGIPAVSFLRYFLKKITIRRVLILCIID